MFIIPVFSGAAVAANPFGGYSRFNISFASFNRGNFFSASRNSFV
jgi:hypothetical protein